MTTIRRAELGDKPAIFEFFREAFPERHRYKVPDLWEWQFEANPYVESGRLPIWLAVDDARIVGQSSMLMVPVLIRGDRVVGCWAVDSIVLPEYRRRGIGSRLIQGYAEHNPLVLSLAISAAIRGIKRDAQGSVDLPPVGVFRRPLRQDPSAVLGGLVGRVARRSGRRRSAVSALVAAVGLHRLGAAILNRRDARRVARDRNATGSEFEIEIADDFGEEHDALWERAAPAFDVAVPRESRYLDWRYSRAPYVDYVTANLSRQGELRGWIVVREARPPERHVGVIADMLVDPSDEAAARAAVAWALGRFSERKIDFAIAATSVPRYEEALRSLGFAKTRDEIGMCRASLPDEDQNRAVAGGAWLLAKADSDWDHYPSGF